jgi:hypothetical protein
MAAAEAQFSQADVTLIESDFCTLDELCARRGIEPAEVEAMIEDGLMPQPAYTLPDGRRMFPDDYFALHDQVGDPERMQAHFSAEFERAAREAGLEFTEEWNPDSEWTDYIDGTYWVCLHDASPVVMVEKERRIRAISRLTRAPEPESEAWRADLRAAVEALDAIERPFTDSDRARWEYTSRGRYITAVRERHPEAFDGRR